MISREELQAISDRYKQVAGFDPATLKSRPSYPLTWQYSPPSGAAQTPRPQGEITMKILFRALAALAPLRDRIRQPGGMAGTARSP